MSNFVLGLLAWTLFEYLSHRFIAHWHERFCAHHEWPLDYSVGPSWAYVGALLSLFWAACAYLGLVWFAGGFTVGYAVYAVAHYRLHHSPAHSRLERKLRRNHNVHHFIDDHSNYGVTSPLWDFVFRTYRTKR